MQSEVDVPAGWASKQLATLAVEDSVTYGVVQPGSNVDGGVPMLRVNNFSGHGLDTSDVLRIAPEVELKYKRTRLSAGDVLITVVGTVGQVAVVPPQLAGWNVARAVAVIRLRDASLSRWVSFWLRAPAAQHALGIAANTTVQTTINLKDLRRLAVSMPPENERLAITNTLSGLDDRSDLLRQTSATLESIAQALFKSWFIDFDPVRAKSEGREPEGMDAATAALFPAEFEESALGRIPKGWPVTRLGNFLELIKGCSYKGSGLSDGDGAHMFNLGCFNARRVFASENVKRYVGEYRPRHSVVSGDLIIANTDMTQARDILGRPTFVPDGFEPGFVSHHVFKVSITNPDRSVATALRLFAFFFLQQESFRERAMGFATGTTVLALPPATVTECPSCLPPDAVLIAFADAVSPLLQRIRLNEKHAAALTDIRERLLPPLVSGRLRVPC